MEYFLLLANEGNSLQTFIRKMSNVNPTAKEKKAGESFKYLPLAKGI